MNPQATVNAPGTTATADPKAANQSNNPTTESTEGKGGALGIGRIVHYRNQEEGHGNTAGDVSPAIVVGFGQDGPNLQVFTNSSSTLFVENVVQGKDPGQWTWPERLSK